MHPAIRRSSRASPYSFRIEGAAHRGGLPVVSLASFANCFEEWGAILGDEVMAGALMDRLMHHCHVVNIRGNSYRMREHADRRLALRPSPDAPTAETVLRRRKKETQAH